MRPGPDWPSLCLDDDLNDDPDCGLNDSSGNHKYIRSNAPPPASSRYLSSRPRKRSSRPHRATKKSQSSNMPLESESETEITPNCWLDPLHPLGGGSSLATAGWLQGYLVDPTRSPEMLRRPNLSEGGQDGEELASWDWHGSTGSYLAREEIDPNTQAATERDRVTGGCIAGVFPGMWTKSEQDMIAALQEPSNRNSPARSAVAYPTPSMVLPSDQACLDNNGPLAGCSPRYNDGGNCDSEYRQESLAAVRAENSQIERPATVVLPDGQEVAEVRHRRRTRYALYAMLGCKRANKASRHSEKAILEAAYQRNPKPGKRTRQGIVEQVSMTNHQVQV